jgi:hypothetical protein
LNSTFNGNALFVQVGCTAVAIYLAAQALLIAFPASARPRSYLRIVSWFSGIIATSIAVFGFYWAILLERVA